jgi:hypothetical protein
MHTHKQRTHIYHTYIHRYIHTHIQHKNTHTHTHSTHKHTHIHTQEANVIASRKGRRNKDKISLAVLMNVNTAANLWLSKAGEADEDDSKMSSPLNMLAKPKDMVIPAAKPITPHDGGWVAASKKAE